ncbi:MAG: bifunctional oligoribonuclease/PAP phosphatase NrnA, partial [Clostridioides sp.]|nr:bifunctional oligoribonuclease/PAP phosphatase NrnA [Clostridioides sp.]
YLYTGIATDTGNFSYPSADEETFEIARDLLIEGADKDSININVFQSNSSDYYKLLGEALGTLEIFESKVSCIYLTQDMLARNNISFNDVDAITPYTRNIKGVEVGILVKQKGENEIKVSLRSKSYFDVSKVAKIFGGGGHVRASGCTINDTVENAKKKIIKEVLKNI